MSLTLGKFRELTKDLPDDVTINTTIEFGNPNSIRGVINNVQIARHPHTHSKDEHIVLSCHSGKPEGHVDVSQLVDKNKWDKIDG